MAGGGSVDDAIAATAMEVPFNTPNISESLGRHTADLIALLNDSAVPPDEELPRRGRPLEMERRVAPCFIRGDEYGTRASTALVVGRETVSFVEQCFGAGGAANGRTTYRWPREAPAI